MTKHLFWREPRKLGRSNTIAHRMVAGRALAMGVVALALCTTASSPAVGQANDRGRALSTREQAAYAREFEKGIREARLSDFDTAYFLSALSGKSQEREQIEPIVALSRYPSLADASRRVHALRALANRLQRRYGLKVPKGSGADYIHIETEVKDRALESWLTLRDAAFQPGIVLDTREDVARHASPRRWQMPIRIAATGNAAFDVEIAAAIRDIKERVPGAPIDAHSFPNPTPAANVFIDWRGIYCPDKAPCRTENLGATLRAAWKRQGVGTAGRASVDALVFFGALGPKGARHQTDITLYDASTAGHRASAWIRSSASNAIETAACAAVAGPGTTGFGAAPLTSETIRAAVRACLAAAMGAPSSYPDWSIRHFPLFPGACCDMRSGSPSNYTQDNLLRQLYR